MGYIEDHKVKFDNLKVSLDLKNRDQLRRKANGGNSILFTYPPEEEKEYLKKLEEMILNENFQIIDISKLLVKYIDSLGWEAFEEYYNDFKDTPHLVFKSEDETVDLMDMIIEEILQADSEDKVSVLVRTGSLYDTGIENVNIMEHSKVMNMKHPLVIFYPCKLENDNLYFLNFKPASKYRCTVID